jgi:phosphate transport system substrate-binding protein
MRQFYGRVGTLLAAAVLFGNASLAMADDISGAGATFPYPIYAKWAEAYKQQTGVGLMPQVLQQNGLVQWPMIIGGAIPVVNIGGIGPGALRLDGATIASIRAALLITLFVLFLSVVARLVSRLFGGRESRVE